MKSVRNPTTLASTDTDSALPSLRRRFRNPTTLASISSCTTQSLLYHLYASGSKATRQCLLASVVAQHRLCSTIGTKAVCDPTMLASISSAPRSLRTTIGMKADQPKTRQHSLVSTVHDPVSTLPSIQRQIQSQQTTSSQY